MFTLGGGGAHCLGAGAAPGALAELSASGAGDRRRPGDRRPARAGPPRPAGPSGARRVCWGAEWRDGARLPLASCSPSSGVAGRGRRGGQPLGAPRGRDRERRRSRSARTSTRSRRRLARRRARRDGGARACCAPGPATGRAPAADLSLVDWADEEGARFGRSLFGSSAFAGTLDPTELAGLTRRRRAQRIADVLAENGVELGAAPRGGGAARTRSAPTSSFTSSRGRCSRRRAPGRRGRRLRRRRAPPLRASRGQASHAGTTPMDLRRDAGLAAAEAALAVERIAVERAASATTGRLDLEPGDRHRGRRRGRARRRPAPPDAARRSRGCWRGRSSGRARRPDGAAAR